MLCRARSGARFTSSGVLNIAAWVVLPLILCLFGPETASPLIALRDRAEYVGQIRSTRLAIPGMMCGNGTGVRRLHVVTDR